MAALPPARPTIGKGHSTRVEDGRFIRGVIRPKARRGGAVGRTGVEGLEEREEADRGRAQPDDPARGQPTDVL